MKRFPLTGGEEGVEGKEAMRIGFAAWRRRRHVRSRPALLMALLACSMAQSETYEGPPGAAGAACDIDTLRDEFGVIRVTMSGTKVCFSLPPSLLSLSLLPHSLSFLALILSLASSMQFAVVRFGASSRSLRAGHSLGNWR